MSAVISVLIPIFLIIALGAASVKFKFFTSKDSYVLTRYGYFGFPILIFYSLLHTDFASIQNTQFIVLNLLNLGITVVVLVALIWSIPSLKEMRGMFLMAGIFGNVAYMGIPISEFLYGQEGVAYASIIVGIGSIYALTVGLSVLELSKTGTVRPGTIALSLIKNPIIISVVLGIGAGALHLSLPAPIDSFFSLVAKSASPIALFAIGMFLVRKFDMSDIGKIALLSALNLAVLPICTIIIGRYMGVTGVPFHVSILQAAMPLAATNFIFAQRYKMGEGVISGAIIVSTVLSVLTIGVVIYLFDQGIL